MKGLAFAYDPDGYWIEIVPRGGLEFGDVKTGEWIAYDYFVLVQVEPTIVYPLLAEDDQCKEESGEFSKMQYGIF